MGGCVGTWYHRGMDNDRDELRPTLVRLPPSLLDAIKAKAIAEERSMAGTIRHALRLYLDLADTGERYRLEFESIDPHQAAAMEQRYGPGVWLGLSDDEWEGLAWHPVIRESSGCDGKVLDQYDTLRGWSDSHEQPIRNVRLFHSEGDGSRSMADGNREAALRATIKELIAEADRAERDGDEITARECIARANGVVDALAIIEAKR